MFETALLYIHILAGSTALLAAVLPVATKKGGTHHVRAGRVYALAMTIVFVTALPLAILGDDIFLLIIAFFSFYLVFAGWRFARNSGGKPLWVDWTAVGIMAVTGLVNVDIWCGDRTVGRFDVGFTRRVWCHRGRSQLGGWEVPPRLVCFGISENSAASNQHACWHHSHDNRRGGRQPRFRTRVDNLDRPNSVDYSRHCVVERKVDPT